MDDVCICDPGVTGRECDQVIGCEECSPENTQSCNRQADGTLECVCNPGFEGLKCDKNSVPGKRFYNTPIDVSAPTCATVGGNRQIQCQAVFASERVPDESNCPGGCPAGSRAKCRIQNWYADDSFDLSKWDGPCNEGKLPPGFEVADKNGLRLKWHRTPIVVSGSCTGVGTTFNKRNEKCYEDFKVGYSDEYENCEGGCGPFFNRSSCLARYWYANANFDVDEWDPCTYASRGYNSPPGFAATDEFGRILS